MKLIQVSIAIAVSAGAASADTVAPPLFDPEPAPPVTETPRDWSGTYAGALVDYDWGQWVNPTDARAPDTYSGFGGGAFVGHNFALGSFVVGGEIAYKRVNLPFDINLGYSVSHLIDFKGRAGICFDDFPIMPYVSGGYSLALVTEPGTSVTLGGYNVGAGADWMFNDRFFVGAEYVFRGLADIDAPNSRFPTHAVQGRIGVNF